MLLLIIACTNVGGLIQHHQQEDLKLIKAQDAMHEIFKHFGTDMTSEK